MRKKPKGTKYRNLHRRGDTIYYERVVDGRRIRISTKESDWDFAAAVRDLYEKQKRINTAMPILDQHLFRDCAAAYLKTMGNRSGTYQDDHARMLDADTGLLTRWFGDLPIDLIGRGELLEWWLAEVEDRGRSARTGRNYLNAMAGVLGLAEDKGLIHESPVDAFRRVLRRRGRGKQGRADEQSGVHVHPIESPAELAAFVEVSAAGFCTRFKNHRIRREATFGHVADMLQLDAGLRLGEAAALRWGDVLSDTRPRDVAPVMTVRLSLSRGKHLEKPKSGRERDVAISARLRRILREFWIAVGQPESSTRVLGRGFHERNYAIRHFDPACLQAGLLDEHGQPRHTPKDLRDTFASQLITAGIQLAYVSVQLGHADQAVTARHYAKWVALDGYRAPISLGEDQVPADLLATICEREHEERDEKIAGKSE